MSQKAFVQSGEILTLTAPYARSSGQGALIGNGIFGVAMDDVANAALGQFKVNGVWDITKDTSTFADGDNVYWDASNKKCTSTVNSNWLIGVATLSNPDATSALGGASGDATVRVRLNGHKCRATFKSAEQTGTGSSQNVAHGLGVVPTRVIVYYSDLSPATTGSVVLTEGTHTSTNVVVTVTTSKKFFVVAFVD